MGTSIFTQKLKTFIDFPSAIALEFTVLKSSSSFIAFECVVPQTLPFSKEVHERVHLRRKGTRKFP